MQETASKRQLLQHLATAAKGLGHEYRLELLELVAQGERSVEALTHLTGLPLGTVSQHLQQLRRAGLVTTRKEGKYVYYSLSDDRVLALLNALREVAEANIAEMKHLLSAYYRDEPALEPVHADNLLARLRDDSVTLLDVRPPEEFEAGHIPGALNIPIEELEQRLGELDQGREVVAYCRGPYCALSVEAVRLLQSHGVRAVRLQEGYPEWKLGITDAQGSWD